METEDRLHLINQAIEIQTSQIGNVIRDELAVAIRDEIRMGVKAIVLCEGNIVEQLKKSECAIRDEIRLGMKALLSDVYGPLNPPPAKACKDHVVSETGGTHD